MKSSIMDFFLPNQEAAFVELLRTGPVRFHSPWLPNFSKTFFCCFLFLFEPCAQLKIIKSLPSLFPTPQKLIPTPPPQEKNSHISLWSCPPLILSVFLHLTEAKMNFLSCYSGLLALWLYLHTPSLADQISCFVSNCNLTLVLSQGISGFVVSANVALGVSYKLNRNKCPIDQERPCYSKLFWALVWNKSVLFKILLQVRTISLLVIIFPSVLVGGNLSSSKEITESKSYNVL